MIRVLLEFGALAVAAWWVTRHDEPAPARTWPEELPGLTPSEIRAGLSLFAVTGYTVRSGEGEILRQWP